MRLHMLDFRTIAGYDTIIISTGVNDFKYGYGSPDITAFIDQGLKLLPRSTRVIFRALTRTAFPHQNELIADLNTKMFDLSCTTPNLTFYDVFWLEDSIFKCFRSVCELLGLIWTANVTKMSEDFR